MPAQVETALARHFALTAFDFGVVKFLDAPALQADQVIVVAALVELKDRLAGFEVLARKETGLLKLRQYAIDGRESDVDALAKERFIDILGRQVPDLALLEQFENLAARQRRLKADVLQALCGVHGSRDRSGIEEAFGYHIGFRRWSENRVRRVLIPLSHRVPAAFMAFAWSVILVALATGCSGWSTADLPGVTPYRIEIQQGNYVSQDMVAKLKRGMSREQVRFVLGSPLLTDMFHANRWDYVFYRERPDQPREERRMSVFFENDRLARVTGDVVPQGGAAKGAPGGTTEGSAKQ